MNKTSLFRQAIGRLFFLFLLSVFLTGCAAQKRSCPPIATAAEATAILKEYSSGLKPLRAAGNCTLSYTNEKGEKFAQSFPVRIWFESNKKFCLYGDVMFDPKGVCFAVTDGRYWTYAKPFGVYIKGEVNTTADDYFSNPAVLVDFLEPVNSGCGNLYMADPDKNFNILVCRDSGGCKAKKIFIDRCSRLVKKIEYLDCSGNPALVVESDGYKNIAGGKISFPRRLTYKHFDEQKGSNLMQIKLDSVQYWKQQPQQVKALFTPPDANSVNKETK